MAILILYVLGAGRLVAGGLACGLNLYATIALIGLGSRLGWIELPPGLIGLEQGLLITGALVLFTAEFIAATVPFLDAAWEAVHTVIRPIAGAALAFTALEPAPLWLRFVGAAISGAAAFAAHSAKTGFRLVITPRRTRRVAYSIAEDTAAIALAVLAIVFPRAALIAALAAILILARVGPRCWRAFGFAVRAARAALRGFFGTRGWTPRTALPTAIGALVHPPDVGLPDARAARAALDCPASGEWRNGWLVLDSRATTFLYRDRFRTRSVRLPRPDDPTASHEWLADVVSWQHDGMDYTLRLLRDGPSAELAIGALQLGAPRA